MNFLPLFCSVRPLKIPLVRVKSEARCQQFVSRLAQVFAATIYAKANLGETMKRLFIVAALLLLQGCKKNVGDGANNDAGTSALQANYGAKKIYFWNRRVLSAEDNIWRSCWYYKEVPPALGFSEREAMLSSENLNTFSILDDHVNKQLGVIVRENLLNGGVAIIPCVAGTVALGAAVVGTAGMASWLLPVSAAATLTGCVKNFDEVVRVTNKWRGAADGLASLHDGKTGMGKKFQVGKSEIDMFRDAIKRAVSLGYEAQPKCAKPLKFEKEILQRGMGDGEIK